LIADILYVHYGMIMLSYKICIHCRFIHPLWIFNSVTDLKCTQ